MTMPGSSALVSNRLWRLLPAAAYRVRIDFKPDGWIDREVVDAIIADNVKAPFSDIAYVRNFRYGYLRRNRSPTARRDVRPRTRRGRGGSMAAEDRPWEGPAGYTDWLADLKERIRQARLRASLSVNHELLLLYWQIGTEISSGRTAGVGAPG